MEGMGLKFISVIGRDLLHHLGMFGPMAGIQHCFKFRTALFFSFLVVQLF